MKISLIQRLGWAILGIITAATPLRAQVFGFGLSVTPSAYSVLAGDAITYTVNVTNLTGLTASDVWVTNAFSTPISIQSINFTRGNGINYSGAIFTNSNTILLDLKQFTPASLVPGFAQATLTLVPQTESLASNIFFTNAVVVIAPELQNVPNSASTNVVVQVTNSTSQANLSLSVSGFAQGVLVGDFLTYRATVTNRGPDSVQNVMLTNIFPAGSTLISVSPTNETLSFNNRVLLLSLGTLSNATASVATVTVQPTNAGVQTFIVAVGASGLTDSNRLNNFFTTNITVGQVVTGQVVATLPSPMTFDPQTGLMNQRVRLTNVSTSAVDSVRLTVSGLTNWLYNAIGTNSGNPFVVYPAALNPGQSVDLILEYFVPTRIPIDIAESDYTAVAVPAFNLASGTNGLFSITRAVPLPDGSLLIEFPSVLGASYSILYSTNVDFSNPLIAQPNIVAPADRVQWIDDGPPKTVSPPASVTSRFYRVLRN